jgi:hypothetical protein
MPKPEERKPTRIEIEAGERELEAGGTEANGSAG